MDGSKFRIRSASDADKDAVFDLFEQIQSLHAKAEPTFFRTPERDETFNQFFDDLMADPEQSLVVICSNAVPVGFCHYFMGTRPKNIYQLELRFAYVYGLVVSEHHRRRGFGRALLDHVKADAKKAGISVIGIDFWSFNDTARRCFHNAGFQVAREHMWLSL